MRPDEFAAEKQRVIRDGEPSDGHNLLGMEIDFTAYLLGLDPVEPSSVEAHRTSDPACLIEASCRAVVGVSLRSAGVAVEDAWATALRYREHEAHCIVFDDDRVVLDCITQMRPGGLYVTARVTIGGADAPTQ